MISGCALLTSSTLKKGLTAYEAGDYDKAMGLWKPLAEQGNADAQFNIGVMYDNGQGVEADPVKALTWYRRAADQGHVKALFNIGEAFRTGRGVDPSMREAVKWYQKAADLGYVKARYALGLIFFAGHLFNLPKDKIILVALIDRGVAVIFVFIFGLILSRFLLKNIEIKE